MVACVLDSKEVKAVEKAVDAEIHDVHMAMEATAQQIFGVFDQIIFVTKKYSAMTTLAKNHPDKAEELEAMVTAFDTLTDQVIADIEAKKKGRKLTIPRIDDLHDYVTKAEEKINRIVTEKGLVPTIDTRGLVYALWHSSVDHLIGYSNRLTKAKKDMLEHFDATLKKFQLFVGQLVEKMESAAELDSLTVSADPLLDISKELAEARAKLISSLKSQTAPGVAARQEQSPSSSPNRSPEHPGTPPSPTSSLGASAAALGADEKQPSPPTFAKGFTTAESLAALSKSSPEAKSNAPQANSDKANAAQHQPAPAAANGKLAAAVGKFAATAPAAVVTPRVDGSTLKSGVRMGATA